MTNRKLCRLCADSKENFIGIYEAEGQKLAIDAKITKCLQIQVNFCQFSFLGFFNILLFDEMRVTNSTRYFW